MEISCDWNEVRVNVSKAEGMETAAMDDGMKTVGDSSMFCNVKLRRTHC